MSIIGHFGNYHNTLSLSPQILHKHCFQFLLGLTMVPKENENNDYVKFGGRNKEYDGKNLNFVAGMMRRFVSAKRLIRYFSNSSKLVEHRAQSPVREVKMLAVWPSIAEGFPTAKFTSYMQQLPLKYLTIFLLHITRELCGWESFCDRRPDC